MSTFTSVFLIFSAFLLGIAVTGFVVSLRQGKISDAGEESHASDLIRLRKNPDSVSLEVVLAGKVFRSVSEMNHVQRTLASYACNDLKAWLSTRDAVLAALPSEIPAPPATEGAESTTAAAVIEAVSAPIAAAASDAPPDQAVLLPPSLSDALGQPASVPEALGGTEDTPKRKQNVFMKMLTRALSTDVPSTRLVTVSIAAQVNQILQQKLKGSSLESRGILLMELPGQDLVVMIGLDKYDSVSAVPDDEIRTVIQSAVNEWLERSKND
jgi:hypothetical protein